MLQSSWLPWRFLIKRLARKNNFIDPISILSILDRFSQPSEVKEPIELLRAGAHFHARGLINRKAIQHNLDWLWPYWVEEQFNPSSSSFIPRSFSITHVNLTHRDWTASGLPASDSYVIVDPRGLVTPLHDGWSFDFWLISEDKKNCLLPSRSRSAKQCLHIDKYLEVITEIENENSLLLSNASQKKEGGKNVCSVTLEGFSNIPAWLIIAIRPYNPEGISLIQSIRAGAEEDYISVNEVNSFSLSSKPDQILLSDYHQGDIYSKIIDQEFSGPKAEINCDVGLATGALMYKLNAKEIRSINLTMPLDGASENRSENASLDYEDLSSWHTLLPPRCELEVPDERFTRLYQETMATLLLLTPGDTFPGPFTYKRFWFRDAAFMLNALISSGYYKEAKRAIELFFDRQNRSGYFLSQEGEWDSNGEVLWILERYLQLTGESAPPSWHQPVVKAAEWIINKRLPKDSDSLHSGLLPPGFSAEHLGTNDYYYWDNFWGVAGLNSAAMLMSRFGDNKRENRFRELGEEYFNTLQTSLNKAASSNRFGAIPASPYRRMDSGAVGSLVGSYPLQITGPLDESMLATANFLVDHCSVKGMFFQDMIHSGMNAYLTLHIAQVLLRAGSMDFFNLIESTLNAASPTGTWPEAIHPRSGGGCMGDGQHGWAAAEWILMMRSLFVREEGSKLILLSGIPPSWVTGSSKISFGPTLTSFGSIKVTIEQSEEMIDVCWDAKWHREAPAIDVALCGHKKILLDGKEDRVTFKKS